jgi:hypothetical protein
MMAVKLVDAAPAPPVGGRFYRSAIGFEQEAARSRLTDNNGKLLMAANPLDGTWGYVQLAEKPYNEQNRERLVAQMALEPYARGVVVAVKSLCELLRVVCPS